MSSTAVKTTSAARGATTLQNIIMSWDNPPWIFNLYGFHKEDGRCWHYELKFLSWTELRRAAVNDLCTGCYEAGLAQVTGPINYLSLVISSKWRL